MRRLIIILIACVLVSVPVVGDAATERRVALVIGNSAYKNAPLSNPVNDATDIAYNLKKLGFKVALKTNATQRTMERAIRDFGKKLRKGGVGLFYFAGHGIQVKGSNYLVPIGAVLESEGDAKYEAVDAGLVLAKMDDAGNGLNIIILDACRNNPFARSFRSSETGLAKMDAPSGSILAYSTAPGSVAADGSGRNGLYTSKLLKHMVTPNLKIEEVFKGVRIDVVSASGKKQTPWESSSLMGDFYFKSDRSIAVVKKPPVAEMKPHQKSPVGGTEFETRELRYAKSLYERGKEAEAKRIVSGLLQNDDDTAIAEAMYCQILWGFATNEREAVERFNAYYPDSIWLTSAEQVVAERGKRRLVTPSEDGFFINDLHMEFAYIKPGKFEMGSPSSEPGRNVDEKQHQVTLTKGFYMQTTEVTQGQWRAIMENNPSKFKNCGDNCPVENVSWNDAQAFIRKLNREEGTNRYRLPTEAEWEYAARAGSTTAFYSGVSDDGLGEYAWYRSNSGKKTHPVADKEPNDWGLFGMYGNVWEWCQDWSATYPSGTVTDPTGPSSGSIRVFRGNGWDSIAIHSRVANRAWREPGDRNGGLGFRLALTPKQ
jgi:formylglycine-generating enzyme required for sulfatase activity